MTPAADSAPRLVELFPDTVRVGARLRAREWRIAVAESCTGGLLGAALTAVPGSSDYVQGGVIAYDNAVKTEWLGIPEAMLGEHGAVSEEVAAAMAGGVRERFGVDVGVGVTGVAGPGSEEGGKPAGLVFVAVTSPLRRRVARLDGDRGRDGNRAAAVRAALSLLLEMA